MNNMHTSIALTSWCTNMYNKYICLVYTISKRFSALNCHFQAMLFWSIFWQHLHLYHLYQCLSWINIFHSYYSYTNVFLTEHNIIKNPNLRWRGRAWLNNVKVQNKFCWLIWIFEWRNNQLYYKLSNCNVQQSGQRKTWCTLNHVWFTTSKSESIHWRVGKKDFRVITKLYSQRNMEYGFIQQVGSKGQLAF